MFIARFVPLVLLSLWATPPRPAPTLTITVTSDPPSSTAEIRIIAANGTLTSQGQTYRAASDTLRVRGTAELTTTDVITMATFIADQPGHRIRATVREGGTEALSARGELIVVTRTPGGPQVQAMAIPVELRRGP